jgi:hypothetical protein
MTLAGAFFSNRARTSAHIAFVTLTGVLGDFIKDLERAGRQGETKSRRYRKNGYVLNQPRTWSARRPPSSKAKIKPNSY